MDRQTIKEMFHSDLTLDQVRKLLKVRHNTIVSIWKEEFGDLAFAERKRLKYRNSKLGAKNPMKGKVKSLHPNWISGERISDRKGYVRVRKPDWYTGSSPDGYVDEHVINYCASRGLTEIPNGMCVHHLDMNKQNNDPKNLIALSNADHRLLHAWIDRVIVQRLSNLE